MTTPPWDNSRSQQYILITGVSSGLGYGIATRLVDKFVASRPISSRKHLILILCARSIEKARSTVFRVREHLEKSIEYSSARKRKSHVKECSDESHSKEILQQVHLYGAGVDLCDLKSIRRLANQLVKGVESDVSAIDDSKSPRSDQFDLKSSSNSETQPFSGKINESADAQDQPTLTLNGLRLPRLDSVILSAGMGGWDGVDYISAVKQFFSNPIEAVTWPKFKIPKIGALVKRRLPKGPDLNPVALGSKQEIDSYLPIGEVFCSNVFGHYLLAHRLMPLLSRPATTTAKTGGKIIWVSSIEAMDKCFSICDIQGVQSAAAYESSKRLIDLLVLGSELPSVKHHSSSFFTFSHTKPKGSNPALSHTEPQIETFVKPKNYLSHPGIFVSGIMSLHSILVALNIFIFYIVRFFGSPWHVIKPYNAAVAPVWLALMDNDDLEKLENGGQAKIKWGSATDPYGKERRVKTEVPGWGINGQVGRSLDADCETLGERGAFVLHNEDRQDFEDLSAQCWKKMEKLRREWEHVMGLNDVET